MATTKAEGITHSPAATLHRRSTLRQTILSQLGEFILWLLPPFPWEVVCMCSCRVRSLQQRNEPTEDIPQQVLQQWLEKFKKLTWRRPWSHECAGSVVVML